MRPFQLTLWVPAVVSLYLCILGVAAGDDSCDMTCDGSFGYTAKIGPECWADCFKDCAGDSQSPINLKSHGKHGKRTCTVDDEDLQYINYDTPSAITLKNNGHSAQGDFHGVHSVKGIGLGGTFQALQFHFHWGSRSSQGSEHRIDGRQFPMELHIVNYDNKYADISEALQHQDGVAVLGFFFEISAEDNPNYQTLVDNLESITHKGDNVEIADFVPSLLLPEDHSDFFRYRGSLTSPGCTETLIWTVFAQTVPISESQMGKFRALLSDHGALVDNNRPLQPIHSRPVQFCRQPSDDSNEDSNED